MPEIDDAIARLNGITARQAEAGRQLTTEVNRHRTRLTNVETTQASQQQIVAGLQTQVADHEGRFDTIDGAVVAMTATLTGFEATTDMLRVAHEQNAQRIDTNDAHIATHTAQIDTHDTWFVALFERVGPNVMWGWIYGISAISAVIIGIYSYFWVFQQYGLEKQFKVNNVLVTVPADPGRFILVSAAVGVGLACVIGSLLSFLLIRRPAAAANQNNPAAANAAQGNDAPANDPINAPGAPPAPPQGGVPAPPAPAPVPAPQPVA